MRRLRFWLPALGLILIFSALALYWAVRPVQTLEEYYRRLYPRQRVVETLCRAEYDYPRLLEAAETVLVVTPADWGLPAGGTGYSVDPSYAGTDLRAKYRIRDPRTYRRVKVLRVIKGEAQPGDEVGVWDSCALTKDEHLLLRHTEGDWPMVNGNVYLLFLDHAVSSYDTADVRTVCGSNGWFDLTHLSLNNPHFRHVLTAALADQDLLVKTGRPDPADPRRQIVTLSTPWTDPKFSLVLRRKEE